MKKKYGILLVLTAVMLTAAVIVPKAVESSVTQVKLVRPVLQQYSEDIYINGTVEELTRKEVYVDIPVVPKEVKVSIGDTVSANQVLATIDVEATRSALFNLVESASVIPEEYVSAASILVDSSMVENYLPEQILAPADGVVTGLTLVSGAVAMPKSAVCTISKTDSMRVKILVSEENAEKAAVNDIVVLKATATKNEKYVGHISRIFPTASQTLVGTSTQTTVGMYVSLEGDYSHLKPGYSVTGVIKKELSKKALSLPYEAVLQDGKNQEYVYVYENGRAVRRNIETGEEFSSGVAVVSGIAKEDYVIKNASDISGNNRLVSLAK